MLMQIPHLHTRIYTGGEWGLIDFSIPGQCVCVLLCVVGIAVYAVPTAVLFEAFGEVLQNKRRREGKVE